MRDGQTADGWGSELAGWLARGRFRRYAHVHLLEQEYARQPFACLLDVGCGSGDLLWHFGELGVRCVGMDLSPVLQDYHARAGRLRVVRADALRVPARERAFDMVTCLGLVEHLDDPIAALSELRRVTCGSGRAVVSVPRRLGLFPLLVPLWYWSGGRHRYGWRSMVGRMYSGALLRSQLAAAGWAVEDVRTFKGGSVLEWLGVPYSHRRARWAEGSWFGRRALSIMVAAVCRNPGPP